MSSVYKGMAAGMCCMPHHKQWDSIQQGLDMFVAAISLTQSSKLANKKKNPPNTKNPTCMHAQKKRGGRVVKGWEPAAKAWSQQLGQLTR